MTAKWNNENIITFLETYEKYDVLWNIENEKYRNRNARDEGMKKLVKELNSKGMVVDIEEIRKRIKTIKTVYSQELMKIEKSKNSGRGRDQIYKPKLVWFETADRYLRNVTGIRKSILNLEISMQESENEVSDDNEECKIEPKKRNLSNNVAQLSTPPKKVKTKCTMNRVEDTIKDLNHVTNMNSLIKPDDELDHFGRYVTASLRQLPLINALRLQKKFQSLIIQERIAVMSRKALLDPVRSHLPIQTSGSPCQQMNLSTESSAHSSANSNYTVVLLE